MEIYVAGKNRKIFIQYKNIKSMVLRMNEDGSINIHSPKYYDFPAISAFIISKEKWIERTVIRQQKRKIIDCEDLKFGTIYWFGEEKKIKRFPSCYNDIYLDDDCIVFRVKNYTSKNIKMVFRKFANHKLEQIIQDKRIKWDENICQKNHLPLPFIQMRYMTSRWGVCSLDKCKITISTRLIHYPIESLEYVLLHEYVHFLIPNHSKKFYDMIRHWMPEYKLYNYYLKG